jgi:alpha/beta superfamily hydrolase
MGDTRLVTPEVNPANQALAHCVLLHPHPDFGGNRFHPFIDNVFRRLPSIHVSAIRFDFSSADPATAHDEVTEAITLGRDQWPAVPAILCGYSFGAGVAATVKDDRVAAWYLLAAPLAMLKDAAVGNDPRPKAVVVPERDQFSPAEAVRRELSDWQTTDFATIPGADHFLGVVDPFVDNALAWIGEKAIRL